MDGHYSITAGGLRGHHLLAFSSQGFLMDGPLRIYSWGCFTALTDCLHMAKRVWKCSNTSRIYSKWIAGECNQ